MRFDSRLSRIQRIALALFALFGAGLACEAGGINVPPNNPTLQAITVVEGLTFTKYIEQLGILPAQNIAPWIVRPIPPPQGGGTITIGGWGPTQADLKSNETPIIMLYEALPNGCNNLATKGRMLGTTNSTNHNWEMANINIPSDVAAVGAVVAYDGRDGRDAPFGNLLILNADRLKPVVVKPALNELLGFKTDFTGRAMPSLCLELWRGARLLGRESADKDGNWRISGVPLEPGKNTIEVRIWLHGEHTTYTDYENYEFTGPVPPQLVWPFGTREGNVYIPNTAMSCVTGWFGKNDFYIEKGYGEHDGLDLGFNCAGKTIKSDVVRSVADGTIIKVREDRLHGKFIVIDHGQWASLYLHLSTQKAMEGETVLAGDEIGIMGDTGDLSTAKHLHLELFWWPIDKEKAINQIKPNEKEIYRLLGDRINLNPQSNEQVFLNTNGNLGCWASPFDVWNLDWSTVYVVVQSGTAFTKTSECP